MCRHTHVFEQMNTICMVIVLPLYTFHDIKFCSEQHRWCLLLKCLQEVFVHKWLSPKVELQMTYSLNQHKKLMPIAVSMPNPSDSWDSTVYANPYIKSMPQCSSSDHQHNIIVSCTCTGMCVLCGDVYTISISDHVIWD